MSSHLENLIQQSLKKKEPLSTIWEKLVVHLENEKTNLEEALVIFNFALNSGLHQSALHAYRHLIKTKRTIPWGHYIQLAFICDERPTAVELESLFKGARKQGLVGELVMFRKWDSLDERFSQFREEFVTQLKAEYQRKKEALKDKLVFLQNQRMINEEKKLLHRLAQLFPNDVKIKKAQEEFQERWARDVIAKSHTSARLEDDKQTRREIDLTEDEIQFANFIRDEMIHLSEGTKRTYDFSIGLFFMELYSHALEVLQAGPLTPPAEWLYVELLLRNRRFIDCLERVNQLEAKFIDDPETTFAANYLRARAFWGLGRQTAAIDLLNSIVNVRPNYRSAHSLLSEWTERNL